MKIQSAKFGKWQKRRLTKNEQVRHLDYMHNLKVVCGLSANTYDSLAETYEYIGDKKSAIKNYKQELELNPQNKDIVEHLKKLMENNK